MQTLYKALDGTIGDDCYAIQKHERNLVRQYEGEPVYKFVEGTGIDRFYIHNLVPFYYVPTGKPAQVVEGHHLNTLSTSKMKWCDCWVEDLTIEKIKGIEESITGMLEKKFLPQASIYVRIPQPPEFSKAFAQLVCDIYNQKYMTLDNAYKIASAQTGISIDHV